jgi:nitroreductase
MVPDSVVETLIDLARYSPSSMNGQPWHFLVITDEAIKAELAAIKNRFCPPEKRAFTADFLRLAPVILVVCVDRGRSFGRAIENGMLAASVILLGAHSMGLGSVCLTAYNGDDPGLARALGHALSLPEGIDPIAILPLGYPDDDIQPRSLVALKDIIHRDRF